MVKNLVIGTAGHVDHGKTELIKALTGMDTDRLPEEKRRGVSIELGFAKLELGEGITAGVVDVPGHAHFLKNMLAGVQGIDLAMLVVAADEGVRPQTREHLEILNLYGKTGLIVLSKIDKVDNEWLELVREELTSLVAGTSFEGVPVCPVSVITGQGIEELKETLLYLAETLPGRDYSIPFRMYIDRRFISKGHGLVVTGTVLAGSVKNEDVLALYPVEKEVRVRSLEWHGRKVEAVNAGQRAAINLAKVDFADVERGMMLGTAGYCRVSESWDVVVRSKRKLESGMRVRVHSGTAEYYGRLYKYANTTDCMKLKLESQVAFVTGEQAIIRLYSPPELIGGIIVIMPSQGKKVLSQERLRLAGSIIANNLEGIIAMTIVEGNLFSMHDLRLKLGCIAADDIQKFLDKEQKKGSITQVGEYYIAAQLLDEWSEKILVLLQEYHNKQPEKAGIPQPLISAEWGVGEQKFNGLLDYWRNKKIIMVKGGIIATPEHLEKFKIQNGKWNELLTAKLKNEAKIFLDMAWLGEIFQVGMDRLTELILRLREAGILIKIAEFYIYHQTFWSIIDILKEHFAAKSALSVAEFRLMLGTSRKYALPLLEYLDAQKYTLRQGDFRVAGPRIR
jgi:selenocysteine-specific elongation factor